MTGSRVEDPTQVGETVGEEGVEQRVLGGEVVGERLLAQAHGARDLADAHLGDALPRHQLPGGVEDLAHRGGTASRVLDDC